MQKKGCVAGNVRFSFDYSEKLKTEESRQKAFGDMTAGLKGDEGLLKDPLKLNQHLRKHGMKLKHWSCE
jgi:hypothetical protein